MPQEKEDSIEKLANLIAKGEDADVDEIEAAYAVLVGDAVRAIHGKDRKRIGFLCNGLRQMYVNLTIRARNSSGRYYKETDPLFHFGRVVGLMDLLDEARNAIVPTDIRVLLDEPDYLELLTVIRMESRTLKEYGKVFGRDTNNVARRVIHMANLGLVTTRPFGKDIIVTITPLGKQALDDKLPLFTTPSSAPT